MHDWPHRSSSSLPRGNASNVARRNRCLCPPTRNIWRSPTMMRTPSSPTPPVGEISHCLRQLAFILNYLCAHDERVVFHILPICTEGARRAKCGVCAEELGPCVVVPNHHGKPSIGVCDGSPGVYFYIFYRGFSDHYRRSYANVAHLRKQR